jgi:pyruvate dehydrogenase phosphatase
MTVDLHRTHALPELSVATIESIPLGTASYAYARAEDLPGTRCDPEEEIWPCPFELLGEEEIQKRMAELAGPKSQVLNVARGWKADSVSFQPCVCSANQDRVVVKKLLAGGKEWTLTGVFDGAHRTQ